MHTLSIENGMNGAWPMMGKPMKALELHYPVIQFVIIRDDAEKEVCPQTFIFCHELHVFFSRARELGENKIGKKQKGPLVKLETKATRISFTFTVTLYYIYTYSYCSVLITCTSETLSQNCDQVCYILQRTISAKTSYCILKYIYNYILISPQIICSYFFSSRAKYIFSLASK